MPIVENFDQSKPKRQLYSWERGTMLNAIALAAFTARPRIIDMGSASRPARQFDKWQVIDHGIEHSQYFQGCGTAFTEYDQCVTGIGAHFAEAYDDACDMLAQSEPNTVDFNKLDKDTIEQFGTTKGTLPKRPCVTSKHGDECYYHVSIRYTLED
jgi:hypothetical protein